MGLKVDSFFSSPLKDPFDEVQWQSRALGDDAEKTVEFPSFWSATAAEITATKYFRRAGGVETSLKQLLRRVTQTLKEESLRQGYWGENEAVVFERELRWLLLNQHAAFNSPVWFNCGLFQAYGIKGTQTELFAWSQDRRIIEEQSYSYLRPQISACYIQSVNPSHMEELARNEEKIFRFGSGTGSNFTPLQNEQLFSWLQKLDRNAGKIKSGGIARRAAKMVCLDIDHPNISEFIEWKVLEERKLQRLVAEGVDGTFESRAFDSLSGQNSNNSIRVSDAFLKAVMSDAMWSLRNSSKQIPARQLWEQLCQAAWECGDPGVQFSDTINRWNTCAGADQIRASNPCSEYMFLDETACNLSSLNLARFYDPQTGFDFVRYRRALRTMFIAQDILVDFAGYPTREVALRSHAFRPLGLGFSNFGGLMMRMGVAYESKQAVEWSSALTGLLHLTALQTSVELARQLGAFAEYEANASSYQKVIDQHVQAWSDLEFSLPSFDGETMSREWRELREDIQKHGIRNAQATVIAPAGTISFFMDCETTGIEPEYSLLRYKSLSGGGMLRMVNQAVALRLEQWNYPPDIISAVLDQIRQEGHLEKITGLKPEHAAVFTVTSPPEGTQHRISWQAQIEVVAAAQQFLSGAISKTVNIPRTSTIEDVSAIYKAAHQKGIKSVALYREGSKSSQPLRSKP